MDEPTPDERFERIPWEHLMPDADPRRRWLGLGMAAVVLVGVVAFLLGSRGAVLPSAAAPPPTSAPSTPSTTTLVTTPVPVPLPSEADLRAPATDLPVVEIALESHLATAFSAPGVWVDGVAVAGAGDGRFLATVDLLEAADGGWVRADPIGLVVSARSEAGRVVVDHLEPVEAPVVSVPVPAGEVGEVPDPVRDALVRLLTPWPGATVERAGSDAGRWWVEVAVPVGGASITTVLWPDLDVGLGSGG